jgi:hypothetical protein
MQAMHLQINSCTKHMPSSHPHSTTSYLCDTICFSTHGLSTQLPISTSANNPAEFQWQAPAADDDIVLAGDFVMLIEA